MSLKARVAIRFRPGVLDPEAITIRRSLESLGFAGIAKLDKVKVIELELEGGDRAKAEAELKQMCEKLLANPVIETYEVEVAG